MTLVVLRLEGKATGAKAAIGEVEAANRKLRTEVTATEVAAQREGAALRGATRDATLMARALGSQGAGRAVGALRVALNGALNPVGLLTTAAIAAGGAIVTSFFHAGEKVATVEDNVKDLAKAVSDLDRAQKEAGRSVADLAKEYGASAEEAAKLFDIKRQLAYLDSVQTLNAAAGSISGSLGNVKFILDTYQLEAEAFSSVGRSAAEIEKAAGAVAGINPDAVTKLAREFEISETSAQLLAQQIASLQMAKGPEAVASALRDVREQLELAAGGLLNMNDEGRKLVANLVAAEDAALKVSQADMAAGIGAAADEATRLAQNLASAAALNYGKIQNTGDSGPDDARRPFYGQRGLKLTPTLYVTQTKQGGGGGRGGGGASTAEANAAAEFIKQLENELALSQELSPVQQEMLRNREALAKATDSQRAEVESLLTQIEAEKAAQEALKYVSEEAGTALIDALMGGVGAGEQLIKTLERAVLQAALLGTGPLAGLFGGGGSIFKGIFTGIFGKAAGGIVHGDGGPTDDRIPTMLSNGEFVATAAATARYRPMLEAMNGGGGLPGYAAGGAVGSRAPTLAPGGAASGGNGRLRIDLGPDLVATVLGQARDQSIEIAQSTLTAYDREVLPRSVKRISNDPRAIGG